MKTAIATNAEYYRDLFGCYQLNRNGKIKAGKTERIPMQPDISVIVPIYNTQAYVGACLQSLLQQTYANFEAICVNDGSTDQSLEVAKRTTAGDARFVFLE